MTDSSDNQSNQKTSISRPMVIGEVLFDCFPDGNAVLGGAPFNVAWHLQGFGLSPLMVSSVGNDKHGERVLKLMQLWNMDTSAMQTDKVHPTGQVTVSVHDGQPDYDIRADQAYDHIQYPPLQKVVMQHKDQQSDFSMMYHGSLLTRTPHSRQVLDQLQSDIAVKSFVDVNLRPPWWSRDDIDRSLRQASWVKLNEDELLSLMQVDNNNSDGLFEHAKAMQQQYKLDLLVVTQGEMGAFCISPDDMISGSPVEVEVVDTVGAGDAFSSVVILGLTQQWSLSIILERALEFAARICQQRGATRVDQAMYERCLSRWTA